MKRWKNIYTNENEKVAKIKQKYIGTIIVNHHCNSFWPQHFFLLSFTFVIIMIIIIILLSTFFSLDSLRANISLDTLLSRFSWRSHNSSRSLLPPDSFRPSLSWKTTSSYWSGRPCHANPVWTLTNISFHNRSHVSLDGLSKVIIDSLPLTVSTLQSAVWSLVGLAIRYLFRY